MAKSSAYDSSRPSDLGEGLWENARNKVDLEYWDLQTPIAINNVVTGLQALLPERYSTLNRGGTGNQGYLFALPSRAGRFLLDHVGWNSSEVLEESIGQVTPDAAVQGSKDAGE